MTAKSIFKSLTSTDKLLISDAFSHYSDIKEITTFLKCHNLYFNNITEVYKCIQEEAKEEGYSSTSKFCRDNRYYKALCEYKKCKNLIYAILENKIDFNTIVIPEEEDIIVGEKTSVVQKKVLESFSTDFITEHNLEIDISPKQQEQIEPKTIYKAVKMKIESPKNIKEKKRFYLRMDEDERVLDDYFDYLNMKNIEGVKNTSNLEKGNSMVDIYPLIVRERDKVVRPLIADDNTKREKISEDEILCPFERLMHKVQTTKRQDKYQWKIELKIIVDYFSNIFEGEEKFQHVYDNMDTVSLQYTIMSIMLIIQDYIMEEEDEERLDIYSDYKKKLSAYCDYYKK